MAWFKREKSAIENPTPVDERRVRTEGLWTKCNSCRAIIWKKDIEANWEVCPKCDHHFRLGARRRLDLLLDEEPWTEFDADLELHRSAAIHRYKALRAAPSGSRAKTRHEGRHHHRRREARGRPVICCSMEFGFIGGSMGAVVGEKVARAIERSLAKASR